MVWFAQIAAIARTQSRSLKWDDQSTILHSMLCPRAFCMRSALYPRAEATVASGQPPPVVRVKVCAEWLLRCARKGPTVLRLMVGMRKFRAWWCGPVFAILSLRWSPCHWVLCASRYTRETATKIRILWSLKNGYNHDAYSDIVGWIARQMDPQEYAMLHKVQPFLGLQRQQGHAPRTQNEEWLHESAPAELA